MCAYSMNEAECEEDHTLIRILVGVQSALTRAGLVTVLSSEDDMEVVAAAEYAEQVVAEARELKPDVVLLGAALPGQDGFATALELRAEVPGCRCAILGSSRDPRDLQRAVEADATGYLVEDCPIEFLIGAVRGVAAGRKAIDPEAALAALNSARCPLTTRERDALRMVARGSTTQEIASGLCLTSGTVRNYLSRAIAKIGARNRVDAIRIADESGWI
jgi:two-component system response regulator DesR